MQNIQYRRQTNDKKEREKPKTHMRTVSGEQKFYTWHFHRCCCEFDLLLGTRRPNVSLLSEECHGALFVGNQYVCTCVLLFQSG